MIEPRDVVQEAIGTLEEWMDGSYLAIGQGRDRQQYKVVQLAKPDLTFEFRPVEHHNGTPVERFRVSIAVERVE